MHNEVSRTEYCGDSERGKAGLVKDVSPRRTTAPVSPFDRLYPTESDISGQRSPLHSRAGKKQTRFCFTDKSVREERSRLLTN